MAVSTRTLCPSGCNRLCEQKYVPYRRSNPTFGVSVCSSARLMEEKETNTGANVFHQRVLCHFKYVTSPPRFKILTGMNRKKPAFLGAIRCIPPQLYHSFEKTETNRAHPKRRYTYLANCTAPRPTRPYSSLVCDAHLLQTEMCCYCSALAMILHCTLLQHSCRTQNNFLTAFHRDS